MPIRKLQTRNIWCDICKLAYPKNHPLHSTPAVLQVMSETQARKGMVKSYCQRCANDLQTWADGSIWSFRDQLNYAIGKEEINGLQIGEL
jgi:hypothetical protein